MTVCYILIFCVHNIATEGVFIVLGRLPTFSASHAESKQHCFPCLLLSHSYKTHWKTLQDRQEGVVMFSNSLEW